MRPVEHLSNFTNWHLWPIPPLREHSLQMALEQLPRVLQVLLGVGLGRGDAVKGVVEEGDDALLFGEGGERNLKLT